MAIAAALLASAVTAGARWSWRTAASAGTGHTAGARPVLLQAGAPERERSIVEALVQAEIDGCTSVINVGRAPLKAAFRFRKATRTLVHQMQAFQELDRVTSEVVRDDDSLIGVVYGEDCDRS